MQKITLSLLVLFAAATAFAQPGPGKCAPGPGCEATCLAQGHGPMGHGFDGGPGDGPPRKMVEGFRLYKLTEYLDLTEKQTEKIYPAIAAMNKAHEEHREQMQEKMKELRALVDDEKTAEAAKLATQIHDLRGEMQAAMHEKQGEILKLLSDEQKAKYILFDKRFEGHLRHVAERLHGRMGERGGKCDDRPHQGRGQGGW